MTKKIRVYIHFRTTSRPWGGGNNFIRALAKAFPRHGIEVIANINDEYEIFLFNNGYEGPGLFLNLRTLRDIRERGCAGLRARLFQLSSLVQRITYQSKPIRCRKILVHRLDGVARLYGRTDPSMDELQIAGNQFADHTVFQSAFCLESFRQEGYAGENFTIIGNGADPDIFFPSDSFRDVSGRPLRLAAAAWSRNPMKGHELLARISQLPEAEISFVGRWPEGLDAKEVRLVGALHQSELAAVLRDQDGFLHAARNDPCPNTVYEALASGLPVLYLDSGGTPEIVRGYGLPLQEPFDECLKEFGESISEIRERVLQDIEKFSVERACREYVNLFQHLCRV